MQTETLLFSLFSSLALLSGVLVIRSKNPVHSVLFLILAFCSVSGLLLMLGLDFFAMVFLVVYVGAIAVLFLFVVMMLNIKTAEVSENVLRYLPIGGLIGLLFILEVLLIVDSDLVPLLRQGPEACPTPSCCRSSAWPGASSARWPGPPAATRRPCGRP